MVGSACTPDGSWRSMRAMADNISRSGRKARCTFHCMTASITALLAASSTNRPSRLLKASCCSLSGDVTRVAVHGLEPMPREMFHDTVCSVDAASPPRVVRISQRIGPACGGATSPNRTWPEASVTRNVTWRNAPMRRSDSTALASSAGRVWSCCSMRANASAPAISSRVSLRAAIAPSTSSSSRKATATTNARRITSRGSSRDSGSGESRRPGSRSGVFPAGMGTVVAS